MFLRRGRAGGIFSQNAQEPFIKKEIKPRQPKFTGHCQIPSMAKVSQICPINAILLSQSVGGYYFICWRNWLFDIKVSWSCLFANMEGHVTEI